MIYAYIQFVHVLGALGISAAYAVEAAGLVGLRQSVLADEARAWFRTRRWVMKLGPASLLLLLASGFYAVLTGWGWPGWIQASLTGFVSLAVIGGLFTGIPTTRFAPVLDRATGALPDDLRSAIRAPVLAASLVMRIAITVAIAFLMVKKPERLEAFGIVLLAGALGAMAGWALGVRRPRMAEQTS